MSCFKFNEKELRDFIFNYEKDENYDKNLDIRYKLIISNKDKNTDKIITLKEGKEKRKVKLHIPGEIKDGQSLRLIKEGKKNNNKYGNLIITINIK